MEELARTLTDESAAAGLLARELPGLGERDWQIASCRVAQTRRRISRRLLTQGGPWLGVAWRLEFGADASGGPGERWVYAKAYRGGTGRQAWHSLRTQADDGSRLGVPCGFVPELELVLWALPSDPRLLRLPEFLAGGRWAAARRPAELSSRIVRLEPEEHCTARFEARGPAGVRSWYGKSYAGEAWRRAGAGLSALWRQAAADPQAFRVGRPLGCDPALGAIWQAEVGGSPLAGALAGPQADRVIARMVRALLAFQAGGPHPTPIEAPAEALEIARKWGRKLALADAALAAPAQAAIAQLEHLPRAPQALVAVHGDFHVDQMLWTGERIALFDYDRLGRGSPARDLADCVSQLLCRSDRADWAELAGRLIERFRAARSRDLDMEEFEWHLRLMLMRKAYSFFVRSREGWPQAAARALVLARAGLAALAMPCGERP